MTTAVNRKITLAFAIFAAVAALMAALVVAPLIDAEPATARAQARLEAVDPPQLWRAESLGADGQETAATYLCADTPLADGFTRTLAEINGEPCRLSGSAVIQPHLFAARCEAFGRTFAVSAATRGDLKRDFRLDFSLAPLDARQPPARAVYHYQRMGRCPTGWAIGDQARTPAPRPVVR